MKGSEREKDKVGEEKERKGVRERVRKRETEEESLRKMDRET